jgi:hypothetical protein
VARNPAAAADIMTQTTPFPPPGGNLIKPFFTFPLFLFLFYRFISYFCGLV